MIHGEIGKSEAIGVRVVSVLGSSAVPRLALPCPEVVSVAVEVLVFGIRSLAERVERLHCPL